MPPNPEDKQYLQWKVAPPSREAHGTEDEIKEALSQPMLHDWRQKGAVLFCISCPWEHATEPRFINYLLQGTDDKGQPILKKLALE